MTQQPGVNMSEPDQPRPERDDRWATEPPPTAHPQGGGQPPAPGWQPGAEPGQITPAPVQAFSAPGQTFPAFDQVAGVPGQPAPVGPPVRRRAWKTLIGVVLLFVFGLALLAGLSNIAGPLAEAEDGFVLLGTLIGIALWLIVCGLMIWLGLRLVTQPKVKRYQQALRAAEQARFGAPPGAWHPGPSQPQQPQQQQPPQGGWPPAGQ